MKSLLSPKKLIIIAILVLVASFFTYNYLSNRNTARVIAVDTSPKNLTKSVSAAGVVQSDTVANLSFLTSSTVTELNVNEGDNVTKGQLLARANLSSTFQSAQATLFQKQQAIADRDQFIENYADNLQAVGGREQYQLQLQKKVDAVNQYDAAYKAQTANYTNYTINAPFDGTVIDVYKEVGENATAGETIIKYGDLTNLYFEALVDQEDYSSVQNGQQAVITLDTYPNEEFMGTVISIPQYVDENSESFKVKISIDSNGKNILYGMTGDVEVVLQTKENANALQFDYLNSNDSDETFVWVVDENGIIQQQVVDVVVEGDLNTEIQQSLSDLNVVIPADSNVELQSGLRAKIVD